MIATPFKIIANTMTTNQIPKTDHSQLVDNAPDENNRQWINQIEIDEHKINNYNIRDYAWIMK